MLTVEQSTDVAEFLRLLHPPGTVFEIRAPNTSDRADGRYTSTHGGYFNDPKLAAEAIASDIPEFAPAIYVTLNPVQPDLLARADNCIKAKMRATTGGKNILKRRWLFFDIDPKRPAEMSATDAETSAAMKLAKSLREYLTGEGWPEPLRGMSGNGIYLLYRIDLAVDDDGLCQSVLESLAGRFNSAKAKIDNTVHDPSRIVKVLGTIARKGTDFKGNGEAEARPHRRSWFFPPELSLTPVSAEQLRQVVSANHTVTTTSKTSHLARTAPGFDQFEHTPDGVENYLVKHGVEVRSRKPISNGTMLILNRCPVHPDIEDYEGSSIGVLVDGGGKISYSNYHNRAGGLRGTQWVDVREALETGYKAFSERQRAEHSWGCGSVSNGVTRHDLVGKSEAKSNSRLISVCMADVQPERIKWLWSCRYPLSKLSILAGMQGQGKSFVTLDMAARISTGTAWPDERDLPIEVGSTIILSLEDGLGDTIRPRLDAAGADVRKIHAIPGVHEVDDSGERTFNITRDVFLLEELIDKLGDVRLVVVDPLTGYLGSQIDAYRDNEVRAGLAPLGDLATRTGVSIIGVMHLRKSSSDQAMFRVLGSVAFTAYARACWLIGEEPEEPGSKLMLSVKLNVARAAPGLRFQIIEPGQVAWSDQPVDITAEDLFGSKAEHPDEARSKVTAAIEWLEQALADGPRRSRDLKREASENCITWRTLERARARMNITASNKGVFGEVWHWELSQEPRP